MVCLSRLCLCGGFWRTEIFKTGVDAVETVPDILAVDGTVDPIITQTAAVVSNSLNATCSISVYSTFLRFSILLSTIDIPLSSIFLPLLPLLPLFSHSPFIFNRMFHCSTQTDCLWPSERLEGKQVSHRPSATTATTGVSGLASYQPLSSHPHTPTARSFPSPPTGVFTGPSVLQRHGDIPFLPLSACVTHSMDGSSSSAMV